jgi:two-component sensor histidine kinase
VATDQAISIGLLVNELITNAVKYAYPVGSGEVRLIVAPAEQDGDLRLEISDRGIGLPAGPGLDKASGLGTKLVSSLSRRIGGQVQWQDARPGTRFVMVFQPHRLPT